MSHACPDVLPDEKDYTKALSLSRLAYDIESLTSPMLATLLLTVINFHWLFAGTAVGFAAFALLVLATALPAATAKKRGRRRVEQYDPRRAHLSRNASFG